MPSNFIIPNSKRRRLVDTWATPKGYDDSMTLSSTTSTPMKQQQQHQQHQSHNDPMDDLGRQHWLHSNTYPIQQRPICTSCYLGQWCYYPKKNNGIEWEHIRLYGIPGIHYAVGYKQLGEMIIKYGSDYCTWPSPVVFSDY